MQGGAGKDAIAGCLAENVVLIGPLSDEPLTGREAAVEMQGHLAHVLGRQPWELRTNGAGRPGYLTDSSCPSTSQPMRWG